jgi:hypothetical protein
MNIQKLLKNIETSVEKLTTLEIKTLIGDLELTNDGKVHIPGGNKVKGISSTIDLVGGDITTYISDDFVKNYPQLVEWHQSREDKGNEIIENNIHTVVNMVKALKDNIFNDENEMVEKKEK